MALSVKGLLKCSYVRVLLGIYEIIGKIDGHLVNLKDHHFDEERERRNELKRRLERLREVRSEESTDLLTRNGKQTAGSERKTQEEERGPQAGGVRGRKGYVVSAASVYRRKAERET